MNRPEAPKPKRPATAKVEIEKLKPIQNLSPDELLKIFNAWNGIKE